MIIDERLLKKAARDYGEGAFNIFNKFGHNSDVNGTFVDIWTTGGDLSRLSSAETMDIVSTSTADDTGGTGAITMRVEGLGNDWSILNEDVTLDGTGTVTTSGSFLRINRMYIVSSGTGQVNAGTITATSSTASTEQARIDTGVGQTEKTQYTVPLGYRVFATELQVNGAEQASMEGIFLANTNNEGWRVKRRVFFPRGDIRISLFGTILDEKTDLKVQAKSIGGANKEVAADWTGYLLKKHS